MPMRPPSEATLMMRAAALRDHDVERRARAVEGPDEGHLDCQVDLVLGLLEEGTSRAAADVVHQDVEAAELLAALADDAFGLRPVEHVPLDRDGPSAPALAHLRSDPRRPLLAQI